jgi:Fur family ferric uptake transcriptional regulator
MSSLAITEILRKNRLRLTDCRIELLTFFSAHTVAVSHADLEIQFAKFDRVTLYRTLATFLKKGLIHKIPDFSGVHHYAICAENCHAGTHYDNHVHFKCSNCSQTRCLSHTTIPIVELPQGFTMRSATYLIEGYCDRCTAEITAN